MKLTKLEESFRVDSEYYSPHFLQLEDRVLKKQAEPFESLGYFIPGPFGSDFHVANYDEEQTFRYVRGKDVKPFFVTNSDNVYVPSADYERMKNFALRIDDVLISVVGTLGNASLVTEDVLPAIYSCKSTVFRSSSIDARYLTVYLNSTYGQRLLLRNTRGTVQTGLNLPDLKSLSIPRFSKEFELTVGNFLTEFQSETKSVEDFYSQAENQLLAALGLDNWQPPQPLTYEYSSSAVWAAGRLDAEHFQPKYDVLLSHLEKHAPRCRKVDDFASWCKRGAQPDYYENGKLAVVNSRHILESGLDYDNFERTDESNWNNPAFHESRIERGDILTYTTGGFAKKPGRTAVYLDDKPALASNHVNIIRILEENPIYVAVALNSIIGMMQASRQSTGSIQQELYPSDIKQFVVPFVEKEVEAQIVENVEASHWSRRRAKRLLEAAKRAVEIAIEENEDAALQFLAEAAQDN